MARADVGRTPVHELGAREPVLALLVALLEELCHHERRPLHLEQGRPEPRLFSKEAGNVEETTRLFLRSRYSNGRVRINLPIFNYYCHILKFQLEMTRLLFRKNCIAKRLGSQVAVMKNNDQKEAQPSTQQQPRFEEKRQNATAQEISSDRYLRFLRGVAHIACVHDLRFHMSSLRMRI